MNEPQAEPDSQKDQRGVNTVWRWAFAGSIGLWLALPGWGIWPLAWIAPACWIWLIRKSDLAGIRPYRWLYLAGLLHWILVLHWIRLPYWALYFGWIALAAYLAAYLPLFVGISRIMVHRWGWSILVAAPITWCGLELMRSYFLSGFSMGLLGHTQVRWLWIIQMADLFGAYGVGFVMVLVAASIVRSLPLAHQPFCIWPLGIAGATVVASISYGMITLQSETQSSQPLDGVRVALIQGSVDTTFDGSLDPRETFGKYQALSRKLVAEQTDPLDLIVWPESMFTSVFPWVDIQEPIRIPAEFDTNDIHEWLVQKQEAGQNKAKWVSRELNAPLLVGTEIEAYGDHDPKRYNSALWFSVAGELVGRYDKMHPVMFGEYIPLGQQLPWLYQLSPMPGGLTAGTSPLAVRVGNVTLSPSICYENTVPHLIRRHVRVLTQQGSSPDALVTLSNDGWFWGSSELDMHLTCGVFRAIEMRRPMLIAANTGFSAWIDASGRILKQGPRRADGTIVATITPSDRKSVYLRFGDALPFVCLLLCCAAVLTGSHRFAPVATHSATVWRR